MARSPTSTAAFTRMERIGKGSYGDVFKARLNDSGRIVVVKEVSLVGISPEEEREILNESQVRESTVFAQWPRVLRLLCRGCVSLGSV